jgi:hypothetical protein
MINKCGCGGNPVKYTMDVGEDFDYLSLCCNKCENNTDYKPTLEEAIDAWNTAHPDITALTQELSDCRTSWALVTAERDELRKALALRDKSIYLIMKYFMQYEIRWDKYAERETQAYPCDHNSNEDNNRFSIAYWLAKAEAEN